MYKSLLVHFRAVYYTIMCKCTHLLPLAIWVESHTVDGAKMTFDSSKLLFIGSVEEPKDREQSQVTTLKPEKCWLLM